MDNQQIWAKLAASGTKRVSERRILGTEQTTNLCKISSLCSLNKGRMIFVFLVYVMPCVEDAPWLLHMWPTGLLGEMLVYVMPCVEDAPWLLHMWPTGLGQASPAHCTGLGCFADAPLQTPPAKQCAVRSVRSVRTVRRFSRWWTRSPSLSEFAANVARRGRPGRAIVRGLPCGTQFRDREVVSSDTPRGSSAHHFAPSRAFESERPISLFTLHLVISLLFAHESSFTNLCSR